MSVKGNKSEIKHFESLLTWQSTSLVISLYEAHWLNLPALWTKARMTSPPRMRNCFLVLSSSRLITNLDPTDTSYILKLASYCFTIGAALVSWYGVDFDVFTSISSDHSSFTASLKTHGLLINISNQVPLRGLTSRFSTGEATMRDTRTVERIRTTFIVNYLCD